MTVPSGILVVRTPDEVAAVLRARRAELGVPLRVIGERSGTALQWVHVVEHGRCRPGTGLLLRLVDALDLQLALMPAVDRLR